MSHIHELIDFTIAAYIVYKGKVLFVHHRALNKWLPVGGHIELDEEPEQALFRELEEETGIKSKDLVVMSSKPDYSSDEQRFLFTPNLLDIHHISDKHWHVGIIYFVKSRTEKIRLAEDEHKDIRWLGWKDLHSLKYVLREDLVYAAEEALRLEKDF